MNATEDEQKDLAKKGRSLMKSNVTVTGRQCKYNFKLQRWICKNQRYLIAAKLTYKINWYYSTNKYLFPLKTVSGDKKTPELKLQGVLLSDNGTVQIPEMPVIITGMICIRWLRYEPEVLIDIYKISIQL